MDTIWREWRGSNSRPPAWQAGALTKLSYTPIYGGPNRTWTCDPLLVRQVLSQLSYRTMWCLEAESNHRHEDFQSSALPTELSRQVAEELGLEPRHLAILPVFKTGSLAIRASFRTLTLLNYLVGRRGIEPLLPGWKPGVLTIKRTPQKWWI